MLAFIQFIAGLAFTLVGLKLFSIYLNRLGPPRFHEVISKFTPNALAASIWGGVFSLVTAGSPSAACCISAGFQTVGALSLEKTFQMVLFSWVGATLLLFLTGFYFKYAILAVTGFSGLCFAFGRPRRWVNVLAAVFSLGMFLVGTQQFSAAAQDILAQESFAPSLELLRRYLVVAIFMGLVIDLSTQSYFGSLVLITGLLKSELFNMDQAYLAMLGVFLGEALNNYLYSRVMAHTFRQAILVLGSTFFLGFSLGLGGYLLEQVAGIPLFIWAASHLSETPSEAFHAIVFLILFVSCIVYQPFMSKMTLWLRGLDEETHDVPIIHISDIPLELLQNHEIALKILQQYEKKLVAALPGQINYLRLNRTDRVQERHAIIQQSYQTLHKIYQHLLSKEGVSQQIGDRLLLAVEIHNLLASLESHVYDYCLLQQRLQTAMVTVKEAELALAHLTEALDAVLLSLMDVIVKGDLFHLEVLHHITFERRDLMRDFRQRHSEHLDLDQQALLQQVTHTFEASLWTVERITEIMIALPRGKEEAEGHLST